MKKALMGVMVLVMFAVACTKSSTSDNSGSIVGKWNLISERVKIYFSGLPLGEQTQAAKPGQYFDLRTNGTVYVNSYDSTTNTYNLDSGNYTYKGDTLSLSGAGLDYAVKVQTLNSNTLTLYTSIDSLSLGIPVKTEVWINLSK